MISPQAIRNQFSHLYTADALPVLEELFMFEFEQAAMVRDQIFNMKSSDRDIAQYSEIHDVPLFVEVGEGEDYTFTRSRQGLSKTYVHSKYGLGISVSEELVDDGKFDLLADMIRKLARSAKESMELQGMAVINNGFTTELTPDGLSLFNTAHTLPSGLTFRNRPSAEVDLSPSSLDAALTDFETQFIGDSGIIYKIQPKILLVHPSLKRYAREIIGSQLRADTSDNNMNSLSQDGLIVMSSPHLVDQDAWFLLSDKLDHGLEIYQRKPLETKAAGPDVGFSNDTIVYKSRYRESLGASRAQGVWGTTGAA